MRLHRLKIPKYRNLCDFEITFTGSSADEDGINRDFRTHAVIGQNGSGKSNMIEAIVTIFRDLDLNEQTPFDYELDYSRKYDNQLYEIRIVNTFGSSLRVTINGEQVDSWLLSDRYGEINGKPERGSARMYLPSHIFTYYSGKSERLEALFRDHQERFIDNLTDFEEELDSDSPLRRLFYCRHPHSKLVLLACLLAPELPLKEILHDLKIEEVDSVLFVLKKPYRLSGDMTSEQIKTGDNRFWFDNTRFTEGFLSKVWELAIAPIDHTEEKTVDFRGRTEPQDLLYLFLKDKDALISLKDHIGDSYRFFQYIEGSYIADLLEDVQIFVKHKNSDDLISFEQLSEGELQLLTVLGLMRITHRDECLFLLDEPDTHLNPIWKLRYFDEIEKVLNQDDNETIQGDSQIIITTHDPMMIGSLRKEQVRIIRKNADSTDVLTPHEHPQGMGVSGLLKSEYFGIRSTVDRETRRRLDRRNFLYAKGDDRSQSEHEELSRLSHELSELGFANDFKDPMYELFVKRMAKMTQFHKDTLTREEQAAQNAAADEIIKSILQKDGNSNRDQQPSVFDQDSQDVTGYATWEGYDPKFLIDEIPLPRLGLASSNIQVTQGFDSQELRYFHFSAVVKHDFTNAIYVAANVELGQVRSRSLPKMKLILDPRIKEGHQLLLDSGAYDLIPIPLVDLRSVAWGSASIAKIAEQYIWHTTNCVFVSKDRWERRPSAWKRLHEQFSKKLHVDRLSEFVGPIHRSDDLVFNGMALPSMLFKVVFFPHGRNLSSIGFLLDLSVSHRLASPSEQLRVVALSEIEKLTGLTFGAASASCVVSRLGIEQTMGFDWSIIIDQISRLKGLK